MTETELQSTPSTTERLGALAAAGEFVERRIARGQLAQGEREASDQIMGQVTPLLSEVDAPSEGVSGLPADALERLKAVPGIGDALAQKALDALTR